jgi:hypothetical protein
MAAVGALACQQVNLTQLADPEFPERMPETVRRLRGAILASVDYDVALVQVVQIGMGVGTAPPEAVAVAGALPCPLSDAYWDGWLWHSFYPFSNYPGRVTLTEPNEVEIDSRGQRRLDDNVLFFSVETLVVAADAGYLPSSLNVNWNFRWLLSLSNRA